MAILSSTGFYGFISSCLKEGKEFIENFQSGFNGHGWKIWKYKDEKYKLEIDSLTVRDTMTVFELLIQKIRAVKGALAITQASGKIAKVTEEETYYAVTLEEDSTLSDGISIETEMSFVTDDLVRCQTFSGIDLRGYYVRVRVEGYLILMDKSEFDRNEKGEVLNPPQIGDEIVQFGNVTDESRQSAIYLHADEDGHPAIDVMFGVGANMDPKSWAGCVKVRLGGDLPGTDGAKGLYSENGMIKAVDEEGKIIYQLSPDGSFNLGRGKIQYNPIGGGSLTFGEGVTLTWDNLSSDAQENLKGEPGADGKNGSDGKDGANGTSPFMIDLSNENASVTCDYEGNPVGEVPPTWATVYRGSSIDRTWTFSYVRNGCSGTSANVDGVFGVSVWTVSEDMASIVITASKSGYADLVATYTINKVYAGAPGEDAEVYWIEPSVTVVKKEKNNVLTPTSVGCVKMQQTGNKTPSVTTAHTLKYQLSNGVETVYTRAVSIGSATWLDFILYEGSTVLDRERIPVVADGADGENGMDGVPGQPGADGKTLYTWIRYADTAQGTGISNSPVGKLYIGFSYNKTSPNESNTASDYAWSLYHGEDGTQGIPGATGENGITYYTWIAYSDYSDGRDLYQIPTNKTKYIGIAVNKEEVKESNEAKDYVWSRFRGEDGTDVNLLEWVQDWDENTTEIDGKKVVSPRIFSGKREPESGQLTGVAIGRVDLEEGKEERIGVYGFKDGVETFKLDARTGNLTVRGSIAETFHTLNYDQAPIGGVDLDFSSGFNWAVTNIAPDPIFLNLPSSREYNGVRCNIINVGTGDKYDSGHNIELSGAFRTNRGLKIESHTNLTASSIRLKVNGIASFYAVPDPKNNDAIVWCLMNASDFYVSHMFQNIFGEWWITLSSGGDLILDYKEE